MFTEFVSAAFGFDSCFLSILNIDHVLRLSLRSYDIELNAEADIR